MVSSVYLVLILGCMLLGYSMSVRQRGCLERSCPLGKFCPVSTNCAANTSMCVVECPTESNIMVRGNWTSGNCETVRNETTHWTDSTYYEIFVTSDQAVNTSIRHILFISSETFQKNNFTYVNLSVDITFTLNGSCPYFYFGSMNETEITFENYYDLYIESVSLALAEPVPPDDYEMKVIITSSDEVLQRIDIVVHVVTQLHTLPPPRTCVEFESSNYRVLWLAGLANVTLALSGQVISESFAVTVITTDCASPLAPATAGEDFTPGSYNATFISGATSATGSIPILFNNTDDEDKQFCLRFYIDGAVYGLGLQKGSNTRATVTISTLLATIKNSTGGNLVPVTNEGNDIMITCEVISVGNALPTVSWSRNDGILSDRVSVNESVSVPTGSGNVSITSKHLTIINSSREDNGVYKCFANNSVSSDSKDVRIAVQVLSLDATRTTIHALLGENVTVNCTPSDSKLEVKWVITTSTDMEMIPPMIVEGSSEGPGSGEGSADMLIPPSDLERRLEYQPPMHQLTLTNVLLTDKGCFMCQIKPSPDDDINISQRIALNIFTNVINIGYSPESLIPENNVINVLAIEEKCFISCFTTQRYENPVWMISRDNFSTGVLPYNGTMVESFGGINFTLTIVNISLYQSDICIDTNGLVFTGNLTCLSQSNSQAQYSVIITTNDLYLQLLSPNPIILKYLQPLSLTILAAQSSDGISNELNFYPVFTPTGQLYTAMNPDNSSQIFILDLGYASSETVGKYTIPFRGDDIILEVIIQDRPKIDEPLPPYIRNGIMNVTIGAPVYMIYPYNVTIVCNIIDGKPPITISWYRNGNLDESRKNVSTYFVIDAKDGDIFTCKATNLDGLDEKTTNISSAHNFCVASHK